MFHCQAGDATIRARLAAREHDSGTASGARLEFWPALRRAYSPPDEIPGVVAIDITAPLDIALARALAALDRPALPSSVAERPTLPYAASAMTLAAPVT